VTVSICPQTGLLLRTQALLVLLLRTALAGSLVFGALSLAGCTGLFHSNARPEQVYFLRATASAQSAAAPAPVQASVRLSRPTANPGLDSPQIVLVQSDRRMSYFLASRWPAPVPSMIETLAVEKLRASRSWQSVADSTSAFPSDYVVQVAVRRFEADYTGGGIAPDVHVVLDCVVGKREGREVIASFLAEGSATATANRLSAVVAAFETAANAALDSLSTQTLEVVRTAMTRRTAERR
jgi:cholesterol transport system auxiliary component